MMPFITEEIWQGFAGGGGSIALAVWPGRSEAHADAEAEASFAVLQDVITAVRQFRSRHRLAPTARFEAVAGVPAAELEAVASLAERVERLAGVVPFSAVDASSERAVGWTAVSTSTGWVSLPPGLFDVDEERTRLLRDRDEASAQLERSRAKLANEGFRAKAAPEVVEQERERVERATDRLAELDAQLAELG
jgi:valyl-tRNA synthetase